MFFPRIGMIFISSEFLLLNSNFDIRVFFLALLCSGLLLRDLGMLGQFGQIQDQGDIAVSQDRCAGYMLDIPVHPAHRLDNGLVLANHLVHHKPHAAAIDPGGYDLLDGRSAAAMREHFPKPDVRHDFPPDAGHVFSVGPGNILPGQLDAFFNGGKRHDVMDIVDLNQQAVDNGHGRAAASG